MNVNIATQQVKSMMRHTCTIQVATVTTAADPYHPGTTNSVVSWTTLAATYAGVRCLWQPMTLEEIAAAGRAGTVVAMVKVYVLFGDLPATLKVRGALPAPETYHRFVNVRDAEGVVDAGPLDIEKIVNMAGQDAMVMLEVKRVQ